MPHQRSSTQGNEMRRTLRRIPSQESRDATSPPSSAQSARTKASSARSRTSQPSDHDFLSSFPPSPSVYFFHQCQLSIISYDVLLTLYCPKALSRTWSETQISITALDKEVEKWRTGLTTTFDFTLQPNDQSLVRQRTSLGFIYYTHKMMIHRPCLCRIDDSIPNESGKSKDFNRSSAITCVQAAQGMMELLPAEVNPVALYQIAPWWCLLQCLMQGITVLMLELSLGVDHIPSEAGNIFHLVKRAIFWLNQMASENESARRAWRMCDGMLRQLAPKIGRNVSDLPSTVPLSQSELQFGFAQEQGWTNDPYSARPYSSGSQSGGPYNYDSHGIFTPAIMNSYDQHMPIIAHPKSRPPSDGNYSRADVRYLFPTSSQMDAMAEQDDRDPRADGYHPQNQ